MSEPFLKLHIFRVEEGLGNACALEFPDESYAVLDWGTQSVDALEKFLNLARGRRMRFVAATHAHSDHTMGLARLLIACADQGIKVEGFYYPASTLHEEQSHLTRARDQARRLNIRCSHIGEDTILAPAGERQPPCLAWAEDGTCDLRVLGPPLTVISQSEIKSLPKGVVPGNETSLVVLFRFVGAPSNGGMGRALLAGDATPAGLTHARAIAKQFGYILENQVFLVPHHGSQLNFPAWLRTYILGVAIISGSATSSYHPSNKVLEQLAEWTGETTPKLFCTAYSHCCAQAFGSRAGPRETHLVKPGECFGDIVVCLPRDKAAILEGSSADGHSRRPFGYCGNKTEPNPHKSSPSRNK